MWRAAAGAARRGACVARRCAGGVAAEDDADMPQGLPTVGSGLLLSHTDYLEVERYAQRAPRKLSLRQSMALADMGGGHRRGSLSPVALEMSIGSIGEAELAEAASQVSTQKRRMIPLANFVRDEVLIRLALTLRSFHFLPRRIVAHPQIHRVFSAHLQNFKLFLATVQPKTPETEGLFADMLQDRLQRHTKLLGFLSQGFREVRVQIDRESDAPEHTMMLAKIERFLNAYVPQRLSRRLLVQHYLSMRRGASVESPDTGIFDSACCPSRVIRQVAEVAEDLCVGEYGVAAGVEFDGNTAATMPYIASHLWYVAREIMKNAMRATVEHAGGHMAVDVPPIRVTTLGRTGGELCIVVSDRGGGMAPGKLQRSWGYGVTDFRTRPREVPGGAGPLVGIGRGQGPTGGSPLPAVSLPGQVDNSDPDAMRLAGHGFGLPLSRSYLRFFGGELSVRSVDGCGTQVYLSLRPLCAWSEDVALLAPASAGGPLRPPHPPPPSAAFGAHARFLRQYEMFAAARAGRPE